MPCRGAPLRSPVCATSESHRSQLLQPSRIRLRPFAFSSAAGNNKRASQGQSKHRIDDRPLACSGNVSLSFTSRRAAVLGSLSVALASLLDSSAAFAAVPSAEPDVADLEASAACSASLPITSRTVGSQTFIPHFFELLRLIIMPVRRIRRRCHTQIGSSAMRSTHWASSLIARPRIRGGTRCAHRSVIGSAFGHVHPACRVELHSAGLCTVIVVCVAHKFL